MIKSIHIRNFQKHKDLKLSFCDSISTITGNSDAGKSAIIRAFQWVAFNRPSGNAFIRHGAKYVEVIIKTDEHTIRRKKSSTENIYEVDGILCETVGRDVPEQVKNALNIQEINVQGQHESPFLLSCTNSDAGKLLNSLVDLTIIDRTILGINRRVKDHNKSISTYQDVLKKQEEELSNYQLLPNAITELDKVQTCYGIYSGKLSRANKLEEMLKKRWLLNDRIQKSAVSLQALGAIVLIENSIALLEKKRSTCRQLQVLVDKYASVKDRSARIYDAFEAEKRLGKVERTYRRYLENKQAFERLYGLYNSSRSAFDRVGVLRHTPDALRALEQLILNKKALEERIATRHDLQALHSVIITKKDKITKLGLDIEALAVEYKEALGGECPLCQSPLG